MSGLAKRPNRIHDKKTFVNDDGLTSTKEHMHIEKKGMIKVPVYQTINQSSRRTIV